MDRLVNLSDTNTVIGILLFTGCVSVLLTSSVNNKNAIIATMIGNYVILTGLIFIIGYLSTAGLELKTRATLFSSILLTMGIVGFSIYLLSKYSHEITRGHIKFLTTFSFLSSLFVVFQMALVMKYLTELKGGTTLTSFDGAKLYGFSFISFFLQLSMYITLSRYVTDG